MPRACVLFAALSIGASCCLADIVPIAPVPNNQVPSSGSGYGSVLTLLNAQNTSGANSDGMEANCNVAPFDKGNATSACTGPFAGMPGGLNDPGNQNNYQSLGDPALGLTPGVAAYQLLLVWNINQEGQDEPITLREIGLALWHDGVSIFGALTPRTDSYTEHELGIGKAGWGYQLDATQAQAAQAAIDAVIAGGGTLNDILITGAFKAGCTSLTAADCGNDGAETLFVDSNLNVVPEPASIIIFGTALVLLFGSLRRRAG